MAKHLVIVESPAKARTLSRYLGSGYLVEASMGHVKDLPKNDFGVDLERDFEPSYIVVPGREKTIQKLRKDAKKADKIFLATDPDREGEAICWHLEQELQAVNPKTFRVLFHEITKSAVQEAFEEPGTIDRNKVEAQMARRILDRIVGYRLSPLLWEKVRRGLSAGRVQSVALRMICEREQEILAFEPEEYWTIEAVLDASEPPEIIALLKKIEGKKAEISDGETAERIVQDLRRADFLVKEITSDVKERRPSPPFITSTLQREAASQLKFAVRKTMMVAQALYEGKEIGDEGHTGLITYMRTDSHRVSKEALNTVRGYIEEKLGSTYLPETQQIYRSKKGAQEAHEAIRPTVIEYTPDRLKPFLNRDEHRLYKLIWDRFVASQMKPALYDATTLDIEAGSYALVAKGSIQRFDGFLKVYGDYRKPREDTVLPPVSQDDALEPKDIKPEQHFTQPPPRFSEATLVKELESNGIGRPSTYASIIETLKNRDYVSREKGHFLPTELGFLVTDLLVNNFEDIMQVEYTALMEEQLDEIESGKLDRVKALGGFYQRFAEDWEKAKANMRNVKTEVEETQEVCDQCGEPMVIRWGKFGHFLACSAYPKCRNTKELKESPLTEEALEVPEIVCEKCGSEMRLKKSRYGYFLACSAYPDCKHTVTLQRDENKLVPQPNEFLDEKCPKCGSQLMRRHGSYGPFVACSNYPDCRYIQQKKSGVPCQRDGCKGEMVERISRKRRSKFYGCSEYPSCRFVLPHEPIAETCPTCGNAFLLLKANRGDSLIKYCHRKECDYSEEVEEGSGG